MATLASADAGAPLPAWADELRRRYLRGESSQFVLHGNVHDIFLYDSKLYTLSEFLAQGVTMGAGFEKCAVGVEKAAN